MKAHAKSGASGQPQLRGSPSSVEMIKHEARSHSTIVASIKSLKLPQLKRKNYVPSSKLNDFENSKIVSHLELRQLDQFKQGLLAPDELSAHIRHMMGIKRGKASHINSLSLADELRNQQARAIDENLEKENILMNIMN